MVSFLDYLRFERNYSAHTIAAYEKDIIQFDDFLASVFDEVTSSGEKDPRMIDTDVIRNWIMYLLDQQVSPRTVNRKLSSLKSFFKFLVKQQVLENNPARLVKGPKVGQPLPSFVREKDIEKVLEEDRYADGFEGTRDRLVMELLYQTGIRRSELVGVKDVDVDLASLTLRVTGKRNKQRLIPFASRLEALIHSYLNIRKEVVDNKNEWFFVQKNGNQLSVAIVYNIVKKRLSEIPALSKRSPHVLRHSFATSMLNNGAELNAVKELLGHSSLASTSVYTHMTFEELKQMYHAHPRAKK